MLSSTSWGRRRDRLFSITFALHLCRMTENFFHQKPLESASFFRPSTSWDFLSGEFKKSIAAVPHLPWCSNTRGVKDNEEVSGRTCAWYLTLFRSSLRAAAEPPSCDAFLRASLLITVFWALFVTRLFSLHRSFQEFSQSTAANTYLFLF